MPGILLSYASGRYPPEPLFQAGIGVLPPVQVDELRDRGPAHRAESPHGVADGEYRVGVDTRRQPQCLLHLFFKQQVPGGQGRAPVIDSCIWLFFWGYR